MTTTLLEALGRELPAGLGQHPPAASWQRGQLKAISSLSVVSWRDDRPMEPLKVADAAEMTEVLSPSFTQSPEAAAHYRAAVRAVRTAGRRTLGRWPRASSG